MEKMDDAQARAFLTQQPVPGFCEAQLAKFTDMDSIHAEPDGPFNPAEVLLQLQQMVGKAVVSFECGGGSVRGQSLVVNKEGRTEPNGKYKAEIKSDDGDGFLEKIEEIADYARTNELPVGMAYGGPIDGSKPKFHPKISILMKALQEKYDGDFANIFSTPFTVLNDGPAGIMSAAVEARSHQTDDPTVFYMINGGGLGIGVYKGNQRYSTEAGHTEAVPEFNPYGVTRPCGIYGDYPCLENIISNKQGIEKQWLEQTGERLNGKEIEDKLRARDIFSAELFELVAQVQANMIYGTAKVFDVDIDDPTVEVIAHGGAIRTPGLKERTAQILWQDKSTSRQITFTEDYHPNACEDGAAIAALLAS